MSEMTLSSGGKSVTITDRLLGELAASGMRDIEGHVFEKDDVEWSPDGLSLQKTTQVREIMEELIRTVHPSLEGARILLVWRKEPRKRRGKQIMAQISKTNPTNRLLCAPWFETEYPDLVIEISIVHWIELKDEQRIALIDHELCHVGLGSNGSYQIIDHDWQEFRAVVERHGCWIDDVRDMKETFGQLDLFKR